MKKLLLMMTAIGLLVSGLAFAGGPDMKTPPPPPPPAVHSGFYVGVHGGISFAGYNSSVYFVTLPDLNLTNILSMDNGLDFGAQAGYRFNRNFRMEGSFTFLHNNFTNGVYSMGSPPILMTTEHESVSSFLFMTNALYTFHIASMVNPFIGFGLGLNHMRVGLSGTSASYRVGTDFAYQAIAGVAFHVMHNMMFALKYRFVGNTGDNYDVVKHYNILEAAFNYYFGG